MATTKYHYEYELRTNNLNYGKMLIKRFRKFKDAANMYYRLRYGKYGCLDIYKVRVYD